MDVLDWDESLATSAQFDDARPLQYIINAICERDDDLIYDDESYVVGRRPTIYKLRWIVDWVYDHAGSFIDMDADYSTDSFSSFPHYYSAEKIAESDHPMLVFPPIGSTSASPGALEAYRNLIVDVLYWLRKFRYRLASKILRTCQSTGDWIDAGIPSVKTVKNEKEFLEAVVIYEASSSIAKTSSRYTDIDGKEYVDETETSVKSATEISGVWVRNDRPINADTILVWAYTGSVYGLSGLNGTHLPGHTGEWNEVRMLSDRERYASSGYAMFGRMECVTVDGRMDGDEYVLETREYSPDGTEYVSSVSRTATSAGGSAKRAEARLKTASAEYGGLSVGVDPTKILCPASGCVCIVPEKTSIQEPPSISADLPGDSVYDYRSVASDIDYGPISLSPVLDYGPYYRYAKAEVAG